jgi:hypothetical protein
MTIDVLLLVPDKVLKALGCLTLSPVRGVRFVSSERVAAEAAGSFDHVLHKAAHDSVLGVADVDAAARLSLLRSVRQAALIEPLERVALFADRGELCCALEGVVRQPRFLVVRSSTGATELAELVRKAGLRFPLVCKPLTACGTSESHLLTVVQADDGLASQSSPLLVQASRRGASSSWLAGRAGPLCLMLSSFTDAALAGICVPRRHRRQGVLCCGLGSLREAAVAA